MCVPAGAGQPIQWTLVFVPDRVLLTGNVAEPFCG